MGGVEDKATRLFEKSVPIRIILLYSLCSHREY